MSVSLDYKDGKNYEDEISHLPSYVTEPLVPNRHHQTMLLYYHHIEQSAYHTPEGLHILTHQNYQQSHQNEEVAVVKNPLCPRKRTNE
jgi:hypothetical protein